MLRVTTFGRFQISDGDVSIGDDSIRSVMLSRLFLYILVHRGKTLTTETIASAIWQEEETENPAGALKNLMYRLRKSLVHAFGEAAYINTNRGSYQWNPDISVELDCEQFEKLIEQAKREPDCGQAIRLYEQALLLYQGDFMNKLTDIHWILAMHTYYHSLFLTAVQGVSELYLETKQYGKLEYVCTEALKLEQTDEQIYANQIRAQMYLGNLQMALDSYMNASHIMEKELGVRNSKLLDEVFQELTLSGKGQNSYNISEVKKDIEEENPSGVFFCGYPIFKEIYHLEARKSVRSSEPENLLLITVEPQEGDTKEVAQFRVRQAMHGLENVIAECLRVGDVAAKYSDSQFVLLLPSCTEELAMQVAERIMDKLRKKSAVCSKIKFKINIEEVSQEGKIVE